MATRWATISTASAFALKVLAQRAIWFQVRRSAPTQRSANGSITRSSSLGTMEWGVVGIYIHGLENAGGKVATKGANPFAHIPYGDDGKRLSSIVKCYTPAGSNSKERYAWIKKHLANAVEEAGPNSQRQLTGLQWQRNARFSASTLTKTRT